MGAGRGGRPAVPSGATAGPRAGGVARPLAGGPKHRAPGGGGGGRGTRRAGGGGGASPGHGQALQSRGYRVDAEASGKTAAEVRRFLAEWTKRMRPVYMAVSLPD